MKKAIKNIITFLAVICIIFVMFAPFVIYVGQKRARLYGFNYKLNGYNYDRFMNFYNRNIKNKNEKAFILDLRSEFERENFLVLGLHDCGRHMLWCKDSDSFHYLRSTVYRQDFSFETNDWPIYCYVFYQQYYELSNPNLEWKKSYDHYNIPPIILSSDSDSIFYELYDTTQEKRVLMMHFSNPDDNSEGYEVIENVKNKLFTKFTETYL